MRPSIYLQAGALFGITRPQPTVTFPTFTDPVTHVTTVMPLSTPQFDSSGRPLYLTPLEDAVTVAAGAQQATTWAPRSMASTQYPPRRSSRGSAAIR